MIASTTCPCRLTLGDVPPPPPGEKPESPLEQAGRVVMALGALLVLGAFLGARRRSKYD